MQDYRKFRGYSIQQKARDEEILLVFLAIWKDTNKKFIYIVISEGDTRGAL